MLIDLITVNSLAINFCLSERDLSNSDGKRAALEAAVSSSNLSDLILQIAEGSRLPGETVLGTILKRSLEAFRVNYLV